MRSIVGAPFMVQPPVRRTSDQEECPEQNTSTTEVGMQETRALDCGPPDMGPFCGPPFKRSSFEEDPAMGS